eukprot:7073402-Lingulodinium_polyedra.AAC.1
MLSLPGHELGPTGLQIKSRFEGDLRQTAITGTISANFWLPLRLLAMTWRCDTEEIESVNSLIKYQVRTSPRISLPLLSARVNTINTCGLGTATAKKLKFSQVKKGH